MRGPAEFSPSASPRSAAFRYQRAMRPYDGAPASNGLRKLFDRLTAGDIENVQEDDQRIQTGLD
ncbi:hypothetical protein RW1_022_00650 [Rhodococcus wratislaviensis NBRC 100605]|uniref:Uncharacterized protein n=1 Tax=Rhodococcus wratislaviensis NBRC 100605 TaxID=1219028 RepID=X0PRJ6_RHOWR|nr:hypothetical protein RW1_022_00650 [Rhodococcus wratislaviensis NBRC 100605]